MKINLKQKLKADPNGATVVEVGNVFKEALFKSSLANAREIYDKLGGDEADLKVDELADIQKAVKEANFFAGIQWQIDDIINGNNS